MAFGPTLSVPRSLLAMSSSEDMGTRFSGPFLYAWYGMAAKTMLLRCRKEDTTYVIIPTYLRLESSTRLRLSALAVERVLHQTTIGTIEYLSVDVLLVARQRQRMRIASAAVRLSSRYDSTDIICSMIRKRLVSAMSLLSGARSVADSQPGQLPIPNLHLLS